ARARVYRAARRIPLPHQRRARRERDSDDDRGRRLHHRRGSAGPQLVRDVGAAGGRHAALVARAASDQPVESIVPDAAEIERRNGTPVVRVVERGGAVRPLRARDGDVSVPVWDITSVIEVIASSADELDLRAGDVEQLARDRTDVTPAVIAATVTGAVRPGALVSGDEWSDRITRYVRVADVFDKDAKFVTAHVSPLGILHGGLPGACM